MSCDYGFAGGVVVVTDVLLEPFDFTLLCFPFFFASVSFVRDVVVEVVAPVSSVAESVRVESVRVVTFLPSRVSRVTVVSELDVAPGVCANIKLTVRKEASVNFFIPDILHRLDLTGQNLFHCCD